MARAIDALDARILLVLDADPWATAVAISRELGVSRNTVNARLQRLRLNGSLNAVSARIPGTALGKGMVSYAWLTLSQMQSNQAIERMKEIPEVVEISKTTGSADFLVRILTADPADLNRVNDALVSVPGVVRSNTSIVLEQTVPYRMAPLLDQLAQRGSASDEGDD